jgi:hypothetical protein
MSCSTINWPLSLSQRNRPCRPIAHSRSRECPHAAGCFLAYLPDRGDPICRALLTATSNDEPETSWHGRRPDRRGGCPSRAEYGYYQWSLWGSGIYTCACEASSDSYSLCSWRYVAVGMRSPRSRRQFLCLLLSKGPKCCRSLQKSRRSPFAELGQSVSVTTSSALPKHATGSRVP